MAAAATTAADLTAVLSLEVLAGYRQDYTSLARWQFLQRFAVMCCDTTCTRPVRILVPPCDV